jgi:hypothetical protein
MYVGLSVAWLSKAHHNVFEMPSAASGTAWHLARTRFPACSLHFKLEFFPSCFVSLPDPAPWHMPLEPFLTGSRPVVFVQTLLRSQAKGCPISAQQGCSQLNLTTFNNISNQKDVTISVLLILSNQLYMFRAILHDHRATGLWRTFSVSHNPTRWKICSQTSY